MALRSRIRTRDFGAKLRITAAALGCTSQKALDALFRAADPDTAFDLARSYKWIQGRAVPRNPKVYDEWARLLDTARGPDWLTASSLEDFADTVGRRHGIAPERLLALARAGPDAGAPDRFLAGSYAVYTSAQSPYFSGRLLRGSLAVTTAKTPGGSLAATLVEQFAGLRASFTGPLLTTEHGLTMALYSATGTVGPVFIGVFRPTPPASLLAGIIMSFAAVHPGGQPPYAARLLAVRVPDKAAGTIEGSNRYLAQGESPGRDLRALGLRVDTVPDMPARMAEWLAGDAWPWAGSDRLSPSDHADLVDRGDRLWLGSAHAGGNGDPGGLEVFHGARAQ